MMPSFAILASLLTLAPAQPPSPAPPALMPTAATPLPPQLKLGRRIQAMRDGATYRSTVVIVTDAASYIQAISAWTPVLRWPVLFDDGSSEGRENIARFVRGYQPASVVRWTMPVPKAPVPADATPGAKGFDAAQTAKIQGALQRVWGVAEPGANYAKLKEAWKKAKHEPPGIVLAAANDRAWAAALPLAAAWGQPIVFIRTPPEGNIDWSMTIAAADALEQEVEQAAEATGFDWQALGDSIDSITICLNGPERITKAGNEFVALTDRLGRKGDGLETKLRWAWSGHIYGDAARCSYNAMCSLFLSPRRAWLFDGYPSSEPWNQFDATKSADILKQAGMTTELNDAPHQGAGDWRASCARPVSTDLIFVNSKGNSDFFDLEPGQCKPGDIPILARPAAAHFVHSWSLLFPGNRSTVGGRWIERGVFAYCGSVHEPFLQAFVPTPTVCGRLMSGSPFAPSVRHEGGPVWKIAVLGDPLYTPGPVPNRTNDPVPLGNLEPIGENLKDQLKEGKYIEGILTMKLLGRDADIAKLVGALLDAKPEAVTSAVARESILPAFRAADPALVARLFAKLPPDIARNGELRDALWLSAYPALRKPEDASLLRTLKDNLREDQLEQDAHSLIAAWGSKFGASAVGGLLSDLRRTYTTKEQLRAIDKAAGK